MNSVQRITIAVAAFVLAFSARSQAAHFEIVPEEKTVLADDSDGIVMAEYARRARDSMTKEKPRTAAVELRRVAALAGRVADSSSGETRDALRAIQSQALKLAYGAETRPDAALRPIREFAVRTENFLEGERAVLEAKDALSRDDMEGVRAWLAVAAQQMERRAQRTGRDRGSQFEDIARDIRDLLEAPDALGSASAGASISGLVKTIRELATPPSGAAKETTSRTSTKVSRTPSRESDAYDQESFGTESSGTGSSSRSRTPEYGSDDSRSDNSKTSAADSSKKQVKGKGRPTKSSSKTTESRKSDRGKSNERESDLSDTPDSVTPPDDRDTNRRETEKSRFDDSSTSDSESLDSPPPDTRQGKDAARDP